MKIALLKQQKIETKTSPLVKKKNFFLICLYKIVRMYFNHACKENYEYKYITACQVCFLLRVLVGRDDFFLKQKFLDIF
jgi:hypothetical protein